MAIQKDTLSVAANGVVANLIAGLRIAQIPLTSAGVSIDLAAIAQEQGSSRNPGQGQIELTMFVGDRQVIERAQVSTLGSDASQKAPKLPDDLLISGEPGLPGELIQIGVRSSDGTNAKNLAYLLTVTEL